MGVRVAACKFLSFLIKSTEVLPDTSVSEDMIGDVVREWEVGYAV